jgi:hypothetical protein
VCILDMFLLEMFCELRITISVTSFTHDLDLMPGRCRVLKYSDAMFSCLKTKEEKSFFSVYVFIHVV